MTTAELFMYFFAFCSATALFAAMFSRNLIHFLIYFYASVLSVSGLLLLTGKNFLFIFMMIAFLIITIAMIYYVISFTPSYDSKLIVPDLRVILPLILAVGLTAGYILYNFELMREFIVLMQSSDASEISNLKTSFTRNDGLASVMLFILVFSAIISVITIVKKEE